MKVYLDNSVVSAMGRDDTPEESSALPTILELFDASKLDLWTSQVTAKEIEDYKGDGKFLETVYRLLKKVPYVESQKLLGMHSFGDRRNWISYPLIEDNPIWSKLRKIGLGERDAHHLMLAVTAECDIFLTCDGDFLKRKSEIEQQFNIRIMRPSNLVDKVTKQCGKDLSL